MTGVSKKAVTKLLVDAGKACVAYHDARVRNLQSKRVQMDEIWSFVGSKERNTKPEKKALDGWGDAWTWVAIDAESKLAISWLIGPRHAGSAQQIMHDVAGRLANRVQLTTDGLHAYWEAAGNAFDCEVDYAQLIKLYGPDNSVAGRYSPPKCIGIEIKPRIGDPDPKYISTSHIERNNLTMRMQMRRFTRLTNAFSKKLENHARMVALHFTHFNFCRVHQTLRVTPAMAAGLADHVWEIEELVALVEAEEAKAIQAGDLKRGHYKAKDSK
jgi:IS1 family transposase